jgi:hypothetical protein
MSNYVETKIGENTDEDFQTLVAELCGCLNWPKEEFENKTLANLFTMIVTEKKVLNLQVIPVDRILSTKVKNLPLNSVVHGVCSELVNRSKKNMDSFAGKTVFMVIKQCHKAVCPALTRAKKPTRRQLDYQLETKRILLRR